MNERLKGYFVGESRHRVSLSAELVCIGGFLLDAGLVGRAATTAVSAVKGMAGAERVDVHLADVLPHYLSTWMPESALNFSLALL